LITHNLRLRSISCRKRYLWNLAKVFLAIAILILSSSSLSHLSLSVKARFIPPFNRLVVYIENCIIMWLTIISLILFTLRRLNDNLHVLLMLRSYSFPHWWHSRFFVVLGCFQSSPSYLSSAYRLLIDLSFTFTFVA